MKTPFFRDILVITAVSVVLASCQYDSNSVLSFIRKVTKISIPGNISTVSEFDQGELEAGGKYQIEEEDVKNFLSGNPFHPIDQQYQYISHFNTYSKNDKIQLADSSHLKYFYGCKGGNSWLFTLNEKTGELWIEVQYPDFGGQGPGCKL
jgi:hypothetical protein